MRLYVLTSLGAWHLQPRVGFGPSFSHSGLNTSGPTADLALSDQREQPLAIIRAAKPSRQPLRPHLHRVLEAQASWIDVGIAGGLRHEQSDHVVGQQVDPQLFLVHLRRLAAQDVHARGGLEVAQVQFDVPATPVGQRQLSWPCCLTKECYPSVCCHSWFFRSSIVGGCGHVVRGLCLCGNGSPTSTFLRG